MRLCDGIQPRGGEPCGSTLEVDLDVGTLDKTGPLALTADDCGLALDAIAGADPAI
jgi:hypothetical protein